MLCGCTLTDCVLCLLDAARAEVADLRDDIAAGEQGRDYLRTLIEEAQRGQRKAEAEVARLTACERDRLAEVEGLTAERDHYRMALHQVEEKTAGAIVAWLRAECVDSGGDASFWGRLWATDIAAGAWRGKAWGGAP